MSPISSFITAIALLSTASATGCARTVVKPVSEPQTAALPRPSRVLVYDAAVTEDDVKENESLIALSVNPRRGREERVEIVAQARNTLSDELVKGINHLGLHAERAKAGTPVPDDALLVIGEFRDVDEGNRAKRLIIGFGSGASRVDARMWVYYSNHGKRSKVLEFDTHADSGKMPGGAVTMSAGAVATGGVSAAGAAGTAAVGGVKAYRSAVDRLIERSAEQATSYLSEYFGRQGWIAPDRVEKAKQ